MRKCRNCLCRTCLKSCNCAGCQKKVESCENYSKFSQINIFGQNPMTRRRAAPRHSWEYYGITKERYRQLTLFIQSGEYASLASLEARRACENASRHILLSVTKNLSYDDLERMWTLKEIERIPVGRSDFYGYRRLFYSLMDKELRRIGK